MTFEEMERGINEIRDVQLVTARLMDRHERDWKERFERAENRVERLEAGLEHLLRAMQSHEDGIAEMRAAMVKLFDRMDRFIQGMDRENGHS
jgi:exonuclease VII small subunit